MKPNSLKRRHRKDRKLMRAIERALQALDKACRDALDAQIELNIEYERDGDKAPQLDIEGYRWLGRIISGKPNDG